MNEFRLKIVLNAEFAVGNHKSDTWFVNFWCESEEDAIELAKQIERFKNYNPKIELI